MPSVTAWRVQLTLKPTEAVHDGHEKAVILKAQTTADTVYCPSRYAAFLRHLRSGEFRLTDPSGP